MNGIHWYIRNQQQKDNLLESIRNQDIGEHGFLCKLEFGTRTLKQNAALWKYFELLADALNSAGLEIHMEFLGKTIDVPWSPGEVKQRIWLPIMQAQTGKTSTAKLDRKEVSEIYEVLSRFMAERHSILVNWPSNQPPMI